MLPEAIFALVCLWLAHRALLIAKFLAVNRGVFLVVRPFTLLGEILPAWRGVNQNMCRAWVLKFDLMEQLGCSVIQYKAIFPSPGTQCVVADAEGAKEVFSNRAFGKPIEDYGLLKFMGSNVVVTEGEQWRRHRRLTAPSFSERNNAMVWDDSRRVVQEWFAVLDLTTNANGACEDADTVQSTLRMALMIISAAAFGRRYPWPTDGSSDPPPPGRQLGFITALKGTLDGTLLKLLLPNWAYQLPLKFPKHVRLCFDELEGFLHDMVRERMEEKAGGAEHKDLFSALVDGVNDEEGEGILTTEELLGNIYIFLLAGHETTAHTLAFIFTLLALYPQHQETLFAEASSGFGDRESTYSDYSSLPYALATVQEALRMFPPVLFIPKIALEDAMIPAHTAVPGDESMRTEVFVKKGTRVAIMSSSLHFNPMYWKEPFEFRPSRFIDTPEEKWNRDAWVPFSGGSRACLGQKFALVESVVIVSHLCLNYTIHIPPSRVEEYRLRPGESERERRERVFRPTNGITLTPKSLPLEFRRRGRRA